MTTSSKEKSFVLLLSFSVMSVMSVISIVHSCDWWCDCVIDSYILIYIYSVYLLLINKIWN